MDRLFTTTHERRLGFVTITSIVVAAIFVAVSLGGLLTPATYARETVNWAGQATAQDWFDLVVAAPALCVAAILAARGSRRAELVLAGLLLYTIYTLTIYAYAVHLNALFLLYCAGLGLALYALIVLATVIDPRVVTRRRAPAVFLIVVGVAFALLWLSQLVPAALTGNDPPELVATGLLTNPVHVLDLSFILPLHVIAGVLMLRGRALGGVLAAVVLAFGALMSASIGVLAAVMEVRGLASGGLPVAGAMAVISGLSIAFLVGLLRAKRPS